MRWLGNPLLFAPGGGSRVESQREKFCELGAGSTSRKGMSMQTEDFEFPGSQGPLSGRLTSPDGEVLATAVFAHCFTCSKDLPAVTRIASRLAHHGIAVMSFDFTGLGHSHGDFSDTNFSTTVEDLRLAVKALGEKSIPPTLLVGHSLGGAAVIRVASDTPTIAAVVTIGAPAHPQHLEKTLGESVTEITDKGEATVTLANRDFVIKEQFLEDIATSDVLSCAHRMKAALLVMHSPLDNIVGIDNAHEIFLAAKHPKSFISLDDAHHLVTKAHDSDYIADVVVSWASRYLDLTPSRTPEVIGDGTVVVSEVVGEKFQQDVLIGNKHSFHADEPEDMGGKDSGPTPYQLVSAGLGACTSMTIRMYATRKNIPLEGVSVEVTHDKRHAEEDPEVEGKHDHFVRRISLEGTLTPEQRASLLVIADKCPVHRSLESVAHIETIDVSGSL